VQRNEPSPYHRARVWGWYLLTPPASKWTAELLLTNKPLSEWDAHQDFDTFQGCRAAQDKIEDFLELELSERRSDTDSDRCYLSDPVAEILVGVQAKIRTSKCVAADDPRLKEK
jgi:hypothetical protein